MIYFIVTACVLNNCELCQKQYIIAISKLKQIIETLNIENYKIIIVENNGSRNTFLNLLGCEVFYTNNNALRTNNKGYKELQDILDCIEKYNIDDNDFIVKMTGRYILEENSEFMRVIKDIHATKYDCVIKYGPYSNPVNYKMNDCITGLIGMTCGYVKQIKKPNPNECVEWKWGEVTYLMDDSKIHIIQDKMGIHICPGCNIYRLV